MNAGSPHTSFDIGPERDLAARSGAPAGPGTGA